MFAAHGALIRPRVIRYVGGGGGESGSRNQSTNSGDGGAGGAGYTLVEWV